MREINFPRWFELDALRYIADHFGGERKEIYRDEDDPLRDEYTFVFHYQMPRDYLVSPNLRPYWSQAKERFPDEPSKGQVELFRMIEFSLPQKEYMTENWRERHLDNWTTKRQGEHWRTQLLATVDKLEKLWGEMPSNFIDMAGGSQDLFRADELYESVPGIDALKAVMKRFQFVEPPGRQTVGQKAEKLRFMRNLSINFLTATGESRPADVAAIASAIFGVSVRAADVPPVIVDME